MRFSCVKVGGGEGEGLIDVSLWIGDLVMSSCSPCSCSGSLLGRHAKRSVSSATTLASTASAETTTIGAEELEETATVVRHVVSGVSDGGDGDGGGGVIRRPLAEWMDEAVEAELERLPREELMEMVNELLVAVAEALPAEVEAARGETRAEVTATMGEELLRMEEQYE